VFLALEGFLVISLEPISKKTLLSLTLRNRTPVVTPMQNSTAATKFGSAKGNRVRNSFSPKSFGYLLAGEARAPPKMGPKTLPIDQTKGMTLNAMGCSSFCGTSSATTWRIRESSISGETHYGPVVRMIPTFPLLAPASVRAMSAHARFCENP